MNAKNVLSCTFAVLIYSWVTDGYANQVTIVNNITTSTACPDGNKVSVFYPEKGITVQKDIPVGSSFKLTGDYSKTPGIGIQVDNWYWTSIKLPVQKGSDTVPQNPDNSGEQFAISDACALTKSPAWFGKGIPTSLIAKVTATKSQGGCTITLTGNKNTDAVTPQCCAPPSFTQGVCKGPWGATQTGKPWPPSP